MCLCLCERVWRVHYDDDKKVRDQGYETVLLEQTLERVGELLQVGFGAAGAEIIGKNMAVHSSLNPMVPGKKITAIYGFCDIRRFTDTTECLQEDVMAQGPASLRFLFFITDGQA